MIDYINGDILHQAPYNVGVDTSYHNTARIYDTPNKAAIDTINHKNGGIWIEDSDSVFIGIILNCFTTNLPLN